MRKVIYRAVAGFFLILAFIGVLFPIIPTVPFVILGVFFLLKSSKRDFARIRKIPYIGKRLYPKMKRWIRWNTRLPSSST